MKKMKMGSSLTFRQEDKLAETQFPWLGRLPYDWDIKPLRILASIDYGKEKPKEDLQESGYPVYGANGIIGYTNEYMYENPVVTVTCRGATSGTVNVTKPKSFVTNNSLIIDSPFLEDIFLSKVLELYGVKRAITGSVQNQITTNSIGSCKIPVPPKKEQKKIGSFIAKGLEELDAPVKKRQELIDLLKEKRQALINKAVTQGLDDDVAMKDSEVEWLGGIPANWESGQLKFFCTRVADYGDTIGSDEYIDDGLRFIRTTDIAEHAGLKSEGVHINPEITEKRVRKNDLLFTRSGSVGTSYIHKDTQPLGFASYLVRFRPNHSKLNPDYLYYFTNSKVFEDWIGLEASQTTMDNVSGDKFARMPMLCPPLNEQKEIVEYLEDKTAKIDEMIEKNEEAIEKLEEYKESLIHHAVTGKIDVRDLDLTGKE